MKKLENYEDILKRLVRPRRNMLIVEKLAGTTPKSAAIFSKIFLRANYRIYNLADSSERYFYRAKEICKLWKIDYSILVNNTEYHHGINLYRDRLSKLLKRKKADIIVYWGPALTCLEPFEGDREKEYLKIFADMKKKYNDDYYNRHKATINKHRKKTKTALSKNDLRAILYDDISCLTKNGVIITNHKKDFKRIGLIMRGLGMIPIKCALKYSELLPYEKIVTIWQRRRNDFGISKE